MTKVTRSTSSALLTTRAAFFAVVLATAVGVTVSALAVIRQVRPASSQGKKSAAKNREEQRKSSPSQQAEQILPDELEDAFYRVLKRDREFNHPKWPFAIKVRDVQEKTLIDATFKHRLAEGQANEYDAVIQARRAVLRFDLKAKVVRAVLEDAEIQRLVSDADTFLINANRLEFPIPITSRLKADETVIPFATYHGNVDGMQGTGRLLSRATAPTERIRFAPGISGLLGVWSAINNRTGRELKGGFVMVRLLRCLRIKRPHAGVGR
jgi:hypothetical protein